MPIDRNRLKLPPAGLASWPEGIGTGSSRPCGHADQPEPARATACRPRQLAGEDRHQQQPDMRTCRSAGAGPSYRLLASPAGRRGSAPAAPGHADRPISRSRPELPPAGLASWPEKIGTSSSRTCRSAGTGSSYRLPASPAGRRESAPAAPGHADRAIGWNRLELPPASLAS